VKIDIFKNINKIKSYSVFQEFLNVHDDFELYVAGGYVRNLYLKHNDFSKDIDLFYKGDLTKLMTKLKDQGRLVKGPFESFRWYPKEGDIYYDIISILEFNNGVENCNNMNDVLKQFDFTANSISFCLKTGSLYNPIDGLNHINSKIIKAVRLDYPNTLLSDRVPISRTSVLWHRLLHYSNKLDFEIEKDTYQWILMNKKYHKDIEIFKKYFFKPTIDFKELN
jgi:tRNA nucleotidyltransferase/poly(A) polymerase